MADNRDILITTYKGLTTSDPTIKFTGGDGTNSYDINAKIYSTNNGTLSFEGSAGQLFSITNSLSGSIFNVNDVSGIPSIEVLDTGLIKLGQYSGNILLGSGTDNGNKLQIAGSGTISGDLSFGGNIIRQSHSSGYFVGSYNNVGSNDAKSNPIYTIGSSYKPTDTSLSNMYGIGYSHSNFTSVLNGGWGLYVASGGTARIGLNADSGLGYATGSWRAPIFYDSDNTGYYLDPASTSNLNAATANILGITNTSSTSGNGLSLYNGAVSGKPDYGIIFAGTATFGTHGGVTSDWATYFTMNDNTSRGWIFKRGSTNVASIDGNGTVTATLFSGTATTARYADLAEKYLTDEEYETGIVIKVGGTKEVTKANKNDKAIGVISENPAYMMNCDLEGGQYVALKGRVPVKVIGTVKKGDKLVPADAGYAMVTTENVYNIFAVALTDSEFGIVEAVIL